MSSASPAAAATPALRVPAARAPAALFGATLFVLAFMAVKALRLLPWHPVRALLLLMASLVGRLDEVRELIATESARSTGSAVFEGLMEFLVPTSRK
jgi:hypothetical protein